MTVVARAAVAIELLPEDEAELRRRGRASAGRGWGVRRRAGVRLVGIGIRPRLRSGQAGAVRRNDGKEDAVQDRQLQADLVRERELREAAGGDGAGFWAAVCGAKRGCIEPTVNIPASWMG